MKAKNPPQSGRHGKLIRKNGRGRKYARTAALIMNEEASQAASNLGESVQVMFEVPVEFAKYYLEPILEVREIYAPSEAEED
jgi:hypothetical protein